MKKLLALLRALQFQFNSEHIQLDNFCLWTPNGYRLVAQKVFMFQILGKTSIFTFPGKVPLSQKCQNDILCGNMNMAVSLCILKLKLFFKNTCATMTAWNYAGLL